MNAVIVDIVGKLAQPLDDTAHTDGACHVAVGAALMFLAIDHLTCGIEQTEFDAARARVSSFMRSALGTVWAGRAQRDGRTC